MSIPRDWERVRTLFHAALDQPPELRDAFLSDACDGDDDLRRRMRSLIAAHSLAPERTEQGGHQNEGGNKDVEIHGQ